MAVHRVPNRADDVAAAIVAIEAEGEQVVSSIQASDGIVLVTRPKPGPRPAKTPTHTR